MLTTSQPDEKKGFQKIAALVTANPIASATFAVGACLLVLCVWMFSFSAVKGKPLSFGAMERAVVGSVLPKSMSDRMFAQSSSLFAEKESPDAAAARGAAEASRAASSAAQDAAAQAAVGGSGSLGMVSAGAQLKGFKGGKLGGLSQGVGGAGKSGGSSGASAGALGAFLAATGRGGAFGAGMNGAGDFGHPGIVGGKWVMHAPRGGSGRRALGGGARGSVGVGGGTGTGSSSSGSTETGTHGGAQGAAEGQGAGESATPAANNAGQQGSSAGAGAGAAPAAPTVGALFDTVVGPAASVTSQMIGLYEPMLTDASTNLGNLVSDDVTGKANGHYGDVDSSCETASNLDPFWNNPISSLIGTLTVNQVDTQELLADNSMSSVSGSAGPNLTPLVSQSGKPLSLSALYTALVVPQTKALNDRVQLDYQLLENIVKPCQADIPNLDPAQDDYVGLINDCFNQTKALLGEYDPILNGTKADPLKPHQKFLGNDQEFDFKANMSNVGLKDLPERGDADNQHPLGDRIGWIDDKHGSFLSTLGEILQPTAGIVDLINNFSGRIKDARGEVSAYHDAVGKEIGVWVGKNSKLPNTPWAQLYRSKPSIAQQADHYRKQLNLVGKGLAAALKKAHNDPTTPKATLDALQQAISDVKVARDAWKRFPSDVTAYNSNPDPAKDPGAIIVEYGRLSAVAAHSQAVANKLTGTDTTGGGSGDDWSDN